MCLVSSGQNITMSSVHRLYRMEWKQYGDPDTEIAAKLLSTSLPFPMFFSLRPDWLALIMRCTLNRSENQRWLYKSGDRIKYWVTYLTHWSASQSYLNLNSICQGKMPTLGKIPSAISMWLGCSWDSLWWVWGTFRAEENNSRLM